MPRSTPKSTRAHRAVLAALALAGYVVTEGRGYTLDRTPPLVLPGKPLSEIIVEERGPGARP